MSNCKIIAMIPARMGSKRVPKKNIRYLLDKPLIKYPIDLAMKNTKVDSVWVNTESDKLGKICSEFGANFHKRPDELANDKATNRDFVYEFLKKHDCDYVVMVNPTSPAITQETFDKFIEYVITNSFDTVLSVVPYKAESYCNDKKINFDGKDKINSQYLDPVEIVVWSITAWKRESVQFLAVMWEDFAFRKMNRLILILRKIGISQKLHYLLEKKEKQKILNIYFKNRITCGQ